MPYAAHMRQEVILPSTPNVPIVRIAWSHHREATTRNRELFVTLSHADRGRLGAEAAAAKRTPAQRREIARHAYLTGAVNSVVDRAPDLTPDQLARLRALFAPAVQGARER
jgi:hypothetical protein